MSIYEINISESEKWDNYVRKTPDYDVFYLNNYLKAFQKQEGGIPILLVYENEDEYAINAVFKRDIAEDIRFSEKLEKGTYYDLTSPYGYGGFIGNIKDEQKLLKEWNHYCIKNGYICEFVRFELFSDYHKFYDGDVESRTHNVIRNLNMSLDDIWMDFKQKVRKNVKKAQKNELQIIIDSTGEYLDDFLRIYYSTMERNHARDSFYFSREFFETINEMKDNIMYFHVLYKGKIISSELVLYSSKNCYSYLGGTDNKYYDVRPNDFLKYEVIKWAQDKGLKNFVLGGGYGADDGIFQYKTALAPKGIVDFYIGKKIFDAEKYDLLVEMRQGTIKDEKYFPAYRG